MEEKLTTEDMEKKIEESLEEYKANAKRAYRIAEGLLMVLFVVYVLLIFVPLIGFIATGHSIAAMVWGCICLAVSICFKNPRLNKDYIFKREKS